MTKPGPPPDVPFTEGCLEPHRTDLRRRYDAAEYSPDAPRDRCRVLVTCATARIDSRTFDTLPALEAVVNFGVGYDHIDVTAAHTRGIIVCNTPDVLTDCVADLTKGCVIDIARGMTAADRYVRQGQWPHAPYPLGHRVSGTRIGIGGLGRVGRAVAHRAESFGMTVAYHNRRAVAGLLYRYFDDQRLLAAASDFLVVCVPGGRDSDSLVDAKVLHELGPSGYLVNVSRGEVVDQTALVEALRGGVITGAALDVFHNEPHVPAELLDPENVLLLPHLGSTTVQSRPQMWELLRSNVTSVISGDTPPTPVRQFAPAR